MEAVLLCFWLSASGFPRCGCGLVEALGGAERRCRASGFPRCGCGLVEALGGAERRCRASGFPRCGCGLVEALGGAERWCRAFRGAVVFVFWVAGGHPGLGRLDGRD